MSDPAEGLVEFLLASIAEDEHDAAATTPVTVDGQWIVTRDKHAADDADPELVQGALPWDNCTDEDYTSGREIIALSAEWQPQAVANLRHIARWDPARVLAECEAKRRIIELVTSEQPLEQGHWEGHGSDERWVADHEPELLRLLALPYADRPGFRDEWRP